MSTREERKTTPVSRCYQNGILTSIVLDILLPLLSVNVNTVLFSSSISTIHSLSKALKKSREIGPECYMMTGTATVSVFAYDRLITVIRIKIYYKINVV